MASEEPRIASFARAFVTAHQLNLYCTRQRKQFVAILFEFLKTSYSRRTTEEQEGEEDTVMTADSDIPFHHGRASGHLPGLRWVKGRQLLTQMEEGNSESY